MHHGKAVQAVEAALAKAGVVLFYLPPHSPELNPIEHLWHHIKYELLQMHNYGSLDALHQAVDDALAIAAAHLGESTTDLCGTASYPIKLQLLGGKGNPCG